jgi:uncharacterized membrane protein AbrB (regulator of aidB expression)
LIVYHQEKAKMIWFNLCMFALALQLGEPPTGDELDPMQNVASYLILIPLLVLLIVTLLFWRRRKRT